MNPKLYRKHWMNNIRTQAKRILREKVGPRDILAGYVLAGFWLPVKDGDFTGGLTGGVVEDAVTLEGEGSPFAAGANDEMEDAIIGILERHLEKRKAARDKRAAPDWQGMAQGGDSK